MYGAILGGGTLYTLLKEIKLITSTQFWPIQMGKEDIHQVFYVCGILGQDGGVIDYSM